MKRGTKPLLIILAFFIIILLLSSLVYAFSISEFFDSVKNKITGKAVATTETNCYDRRDNDRDTWFDYADSDDCTQEMCESHGKVVMNIIAGWGEGSPNWGSLSAYAGCCKSNQCYSANPSRGGCFNDKEILKIEGTGNFFICSNKVWCKNGYVNNGRGECVLKSCDTSADCDSRQTFSTCKDARTRTITSIVYPCVGNKCISSTTTIDQKCGSGTICENGICVREEDDEPDEEEEGEILGCCFRKSIFGREYHIQKYEEDCKSSWILRKISWCPGPYECSCDIDGKSFQASSLISGDAKSSQTSSLEKKEGDKCSNCLAQGSDCPEGWTRNPKESEPHTCCNPKTHVACENEAYCCPGNNVGVNCKNKGERAHCAVTKDQCKNLKDKDSNSFIRCSGKWPADEKTICCPPDTKCGLVTVGSFLGMKAKIPSCVYNQKEQGFDDPPEKDGCPGTKEEYFVCDNKAIEDKKNNKMCCKTGKEICDYIKEPEEPKPENLACILNINQEDCAPDEILCRGKSPWNNNEGCCKKTADGKSQCYYDFSGYARCMDGRKGIVPGRID